MTVETSTYISQLNSALPAVGDLKSEGDEHIRKIKANLLATFPNLTAAPVTASTTELNYVTGVTSSIQTQLNGGMTWTPAGTGAVTRTIESGMRQVVSVKDFGALGDNSNDDTAEIQAALDYAGTIVQTIFTNKVDIVTAKVLLPAGRYKTSAVLTIPEGVTFEGESPSTAIILPQHSGVAVQMGGSSREYSQLKVRSIGIVGKWAGTLGYGTWTTSTTVGISVENCIRECYIEDCFITYCDKSIQLESSYAFEINHNYLYYAKTSHIEWDVAVNGTIRGNRIDACEGNGIYINGSAAAADETFALIIEGNAIQSNYQDGILLYDCHSATILNNFFEANYRSATAATYTYADINIKEGTYTRGYSFSLIGNFFTSGSSPDEDVFTAIRCDRAVSLVCTGNVCRDSWYYRFIDADNANVERIVALGNSYEGTFSKIVYNAACFGIIEENVSDGSIYVPKLIAGSSQLGATVSSSNQTTSEYKSVYLINCSGGNRQVNLRDADCVAGRVYTVKKTDSGAVNTIKFIPEGGSTKTIDGAAQLATTAAYGSLTVTSDGTNWFSI